MRIGAPLNLPQLQQRQTLPKAVPTDSQSDDQARSQPQAVAAEPSRTEFSAELFSARSQENSDSHFYSTDRQLSSNGKAAMDTYIANAGLALNDSHAEWIGVDVYA